MRHAIACAGLAMLIACSRESPPATGTAAPPAGTPVAAGSKAEEAKREDLPKIVFLGDSITAGLGLPSDQSYPAIIGKRLKAGGQQYAIVNAGVSGDTSAAGLRRVDWSLEGDVRLLIVALGGNDGLRGLPPAELKKNLAAVLERARAREIPVILAGMEAPPNNGPDYTTAFRGVYAELAAEYKVRFIPFLLQGVAGDAALNQPDGIHPNSRGAEIVADLVWKELQPALARRN